MRKSAICLVILGGRMEKDRLAAFMDAVLAIIMTILVLELPKPKTVDFMSIWDLRTVYFSYALSFFWLGTMWYHIHNEWHEVKRISKAVVWWGLILLFSSSWIPYTMSLVNVDLMNVTGQVFYGIAVFMVTFSNIALSIAVEKCHNRDSEEKFKNEISMRRKKLYPDIIIKIIGLILTITVFPMAMSFAVLITMVWMIIPVKSR